MNETNVKKNIRKEYLEYLCQFNWHLRLKEEIYAEVPLSNFACKHKELKDRFLTTKVVWMYFDQFDE